ncbi:MAG: hypothetical protein OK438_08615 [Thaumarchaeota archaeon]|nr:hypothetical protein [Nitrososphaerota archaeon]
MQTKTEDEEGEVYYVPGSELIAVPYHSLGQIRRIRQEHHRREVQHAILLASSLKRA